MIMYTNIDTERYEQDNRPPKIHSFIKCSKMHSFAKRQQSKIIKISYVRTLKIYKMHKKKICRVFIQVKWVTLNVNELSGVLTCIIPKAVFISLTSSPGSLENQ